MPLEQPKRRYVMKLEIGADTFRDLLGRLNSIQFDLERAIEGELDRDYSAVSGGYDAGWVLGIKFDPTMDHDRYVEVLNAYLAERDVNSVQLQTDANGPLEPIKFDY